MIGFVFSYNAGIAESAEGLIRLSSDFLHFQWSMKRSFNSHSLIIALRYRSTDLICSVFGILLLYIYSYIIYKLSNHKSSEFFTYFATESAEDSETELCVVAALSHLP